MWNVPEVYTEIYNLFLICVIFEFLKNHEQDCKIASMVLEFPEVYFKLYIIFWCRMILSWGREIKGPLPFYEACDFSSAMLILARVLPFLQRKTILSIEFSRYSQNFPATDTCPL